MGKVRESGREGETQRAGEKHAVRDTSIGCLPHAPGPEPGTEPATEVHALAGIEPWTSPGPFSPGADALITDPNQPARARIVFFTIKASIQYTPKCDLSFALPLTGFSFINRFLNQGNKTLSDYVS